MLIFDESQAERVDEHGPCYEALPDSPPKGPLFGGSPGKQDSYIVQNTLKAVAMMTFLEVLSNSVRTLTTTHEGPPETTDTSIPHEIQTYEIQWTALPAPAQERSEDDKIRGLKCKMLRNLKRIMEQRDAIFDQTVANQPWFVEIMTKATSNPEASALEEYIAKTEVDLDSTTIEQLEVNLSKARELETKAKAIGKSPAEWLPRIIMLIVSIAAFYMEKTQKSLQKVKNFRRQHRPKNSTL